MKREVNKQGQVTIFIILAILIASTILIFFLVVKPSIETQTQSPLDFESCVKSEVQEVINNLALKGGYNNPSFTYPYKGEEISYFCYAENKGEACKVNNPFPKNKFISELEIALTPLIENCYEKSLKTLQNYGYEVQAGEVNTNISIKPKYIQVNILAPTTIESQNYEEFEFKVPSRIYTTFNIIDEIMNSEIYNGDSETLYFIHKYSDYNIIKLKQEEGVHLYTIEDLRDQIQFKFAIKSWTLPAGYFDLE